MFKGKNRRLAAILIIAAVITAVVSWLSYFNPSVSSLPYGAGNESDYGQSVVRDLLEELGFNVRVKRSGAEGLPENAVVITSAPQYLQTPPREYRELCAFIYGGGTLIMFGDYPGWRRAASEYVAEELPALIREGSAPDSFSKEYGKGRIVAYADESALQNGWLRYKDYRGPAYRLVGILWDYRGRTVYFDDYRRSEHPVSFDTGEPEDFNYEAVPPGLSSILAQIVLALFLGLLLAGRRLGAPEIYRDDEVRERNEDIKAVAGLMRKARVPGEAAVVCYKKFCAEVLGKGFDAENLADIAGRLEAEWASRGLPMAGELRRLNTRVIEAAYRKPDEKTAVSIVAGIDVLRKAMT